MAEAQQDKPADRPVGATGASAGGSVEKSFGRSADRVAGKDRSTVSGSSDAAGESSRVMPEKLAISSSPHVHGPDSISKIMWTVVACLVPAAAVGIYRFGLDAAIVLATTTGSAIVFEALFQKMGGKDVTVSDGSATLTGLLLGMNLPAGTPIFICVVGSLVAVGLAKAVFGGLGYNPFNPALTGRVFLLIAFPVAMTTWRLPQQMNAHGPKKQYYGMSTTWRNQAGKRLEQKRRNAKKVDVVTAATPLSALKEGWKKGTMALVSHTDLLQGDRPGSIGEVSGIALILGGLVLLLMGYITWHIPVAFLATMGVIAAITHGVNPQRYAPPLFHVLAGGALIGSFFMATDYVTSPTYPWGKILFGVGCGLITMIIRLWGGYPEGVSFAILLMNSVTPLIDRFTRPRKYGLKLWAGPQEDAS